MNRVALPAWLIFYLAFAACAPARAGTWSWNLGYNNPPGAEIIGLNFMHLWTNVAFEAGIGTIHTDGDNKKESENLHVLGDANLKYLFMQGVLRPYLQIGTPIGASGGTSGVGAGGGHGIFFGGGFFMMGKSSNTMKASNSFVTSVHREGKNSTPMTRRTRIGMHKKIF